MHISTPLKNQSETHRVASALSTTDQVSAPAALPFLETGKFQIGANYWASHAGTHMWSEWREDVVAQDFSRLAENGLSVLRVFPLWSEFQPIHALFNSHGDIYEYRHGEEPLPETPIGQSGVSIEMLQRFEILCDHAHKNGLQLVVGLITGWMSGRLFAPPALERLNHICDPESIMWQLRFIKTFVNHFKDHPAIHAWDLGNECNCLAKASREQAWLWTSTVSNAVRSADPTRPVISGMHGLSADPKAKWTIKDQGELTDILTTHPYPLFTQHCNREPMDTLRPLLHGTAETCLYADISGKPSFVEETGNFGPAFCDETKGALIATTQCYSLWAHDCRGLLWWCAHEQNNLEKAPYDWISMERQLGLLRDDGTPKPLLPAMEEVVSNINSLKSLDRLPPRNIDGVCILTNGQDQWGAGYSAFLLGKQAGFDIRFCDGEHTFPESDFYLLPSVGQLNALSRRRERELMKRVHEGATLYVSMDDGFLGDIMQLTGLHVIGRCKRAAPCAFEFADQTFTVSSTTEYQLAPGTATILANEAGNPVLSQASYGKGTVYFLSVPLETYLAETNGAFLENASPYWRIYQRIASGILAKRHVQKTSPSIGITEHLAEDGTLSVLLMNLQPGIAHSQISFSAGYEWIESLSGPKPQQEADGFSLELPHNGIAIWKFAPTSQA